MMPNNAKKAAVLAIVIQAVVRVGKRALRNRIMIALAAIAFIAIFFFNVPFPIIIIAAGVIGYFGAKAGGAEFAAVEHGGGKNAAAVDAMLVSGVVYCGLRWRPRTAVPELR